MRFRLVPSLGLALTAALVCVPAGASSAAADPSDGVLDVRSAALGDQSVVILRVASSSAVARVTLTAPAGYSIDLDEPVGRELGFASAGLSDVPGTTSSFADGSLVVDDPARYRGTPEAEACAPGPHAAVWRTTLSVLGQQFALPIYVDRGSSADPNAPAFVMRYCPIWPSPTVPAGVTAHSLSLFVYDVIRPPTTTGRFTWSALVSPPVSGGMSPNEARTFEVRAVEPLPHTLTLRARHDAKKHSVQLSGKLTAVGQPEAGVEIEFYAATDSFSETTFFGPVTTNAAGEFSITRRIDVSTQFSADAFVSPTQCVAPSTAPAGCAQETVSAPTGASAIVRVRLPTDPKLSVVPRDQSAARRSNLTIGDFPADWDAYDSFSFFACPGFRPKLSDLTATGDFESKVFANEEATASSHATVFATEAQARSAFGRTARLAAARCLADALRADGVTVLQLRPIPFVAVGNESKAFRVVFAQGEYVVNVDFVSFRVGRTVVQLGFASATQPLLIADDLALKVAVRVRRG